MPERYNIAADVCDKHPRSKPAMVWERYDGETREVDWGELQDLANQAAHLLATTGSRRATASPSSCRRPPRPPRSSSAPGSSARSCSRCRCSTATTGSATASRTPSRRLLITDEANVDALRRLAGRRDPRPRRGRRLLAGHPTDHVCEDTSADDPAQLYYTSGTTGKAKGIVHAHRYILAHEEFVYCHDVQRRRALPRHGRVGLGRGHLPAARPVAARRGPVRPPARGGLRPRRPARLPLAPRGVATSSRPRPRCGR